MALKVWGYLEVLGSTDLNGNFTYLESEIAEVINLIKALSGTGTLLKAIKDNSLSAKDSGVVNCSSGVSTEIVALNLGAVTEGDLFNIFAKIDGAYVTNGGSGHIQITKKSGTAKIGWIFDTAVSGNNEELRQGLIAPSGATGAFSSICSRLIIAASGTLVLKLEVYRPDANYNTSNERCGLYAEPLFLQ